ncbi:MAG: GDSL-type esterase/lipase family protein [Puniceicoccales bacterium]|jgi:lysophospholipase L1-like esterase|nr:GDSL-type esterase/lipase family protein [Puniceicoccales bacterium]
MNKIFPTLLLTAMATGVLHAEVSSEKNNASEVTGENTAIIPVSKLEQDSYDWFKRHEEVLAAQKTLNPEVVLIGDSITHFWGGEPKSKQNGPKAWQMTFAKYSVLNMGFGWDRTQNVLWRLKNGEMDGLKPKVIILNIGTNNLSGTRNARANTPGEICDGIVEICKLLRQKSPSSQVVVMGIFPRKNQAFFEKIKTINSLIPQKLAGQPSTRFLDISQKMLNADGTFRDDLFLDGTHPNEQGYAIWGQALAASGLLPERHDNAK